MDFSVGSTHFKVSLGALAGLAVGLFLFFRFGHGGSAALDRWLASGTAQVQLDRRLFERDALAQAQAAAFREQARRLAVRKAADSAAAQHALDSLARRLAAVATEGDRGAASTEFVAACQRILVEATANCEARALFWQRADSTDSTRAMTLAAELQAADTSLRRGVELADCHLLHVGPIKALRCPSRATSFKIGVVGGAFVVEG